MSRTSLDTYKTKEYLLRKCTCKKCGGHVEVFSFIRKGTFVEHKKGDCKKTTRILSQG